MSRKESQSKYKKGPGVFVYQGGEYDTEWVPTLMRWPRREAAYNADGTPKLDAAGRQVYEREGDVMLGPDQKPQYGGPPVVKRTERRVNVGTAEEPKWVHGLKMGGVLFQKGEPVRVEDLALALKLRGMKSFSEVVDEDEVRESDLASLSKAELLDLAKNEGVEVPEGAKKGELLKLLEEARAA